MNKETIKTIKQIKKDSAKGFRITIEDLDTGDVIMNEKTKGVMGSILTKDGATAFNASKCSTLEVFHLMECTKKVLDETRSLINKGIKKDFFDLLKEIIKDDEE